MSVSLLFLQVSRLFSISLSLHILYLLKQTSQPGSRPGREILVINSHAAVKAHAGSMHTHHFKQNLLKMA